MISIAMIVCNEETYIERCLKSIHDYEFVEEIVVVDGGSTDGTKEILGRFPKVRVIDIPFNPSGGDRFDIQRNHSVMACKNEWILVIDADETYDADLMNSIPSLMVPESLGLPWNADAYWFSRRTFLDGNLANIINNDYQTRFFKHYCRYNGAMHEGVTGYSHCTSANLHIRHDKTGEKQQKDNERVWSMGQQPAEGWEQVDGEWTNTKA